MNEITMNDLPNELIFEILKRLGPETLKNVALTCKLWKHFIDTSRTWSLVLSHENKKNSKEPWFDYCLTTKRKFHTIEVNYLILDENNSIIEIFKRLGSSVVKLVFRESCIDSLDIFAEMLKYLPNLEHIILNEADTNGDVSNMKNLPELTKLKTLEFVKSEYRILKCFARSQFKTIKIHGSSYVCPNESVEDITDLFRSQHELTSLAIRRIHYKTSELFRTEILHGGMGFHLTKLSLLDIELQEIPNHYNNLLNLMKHHAKTIQELELGRKFPNFVYEFVFREFDNLQSLQLMINELPKEIEFYVSLEENRSIINLILTDSTPSSGCPLWLQEFIKHVPNVTKLTLLEKCNKETVLFIASNLTGLKKLATKYFDGFLFGGVRFPKLTALNIHKLNAEIDWHTFTKDNSQITELTIETVVDEYEVLQNYDIETITKNLKLETLKIGDNFIPSGSSVDFFNMIFKNCPNLQVFYLHEICNFNSAEIIEEEEFENEENLYGFRTAPKPNLQLCDSTANCTITYCKGLEFWVDDGNSSDDCDSDSGDELNSSGNYLMDMDSYSIESDYDDSDDDHDDDDDNDDEDDDYDDDYDDDCDDDDDDCDDDDDDFDDDDDCDDDDDDCDDDDDDCDDDDDDCDDDDDDCDDDDDDCDDDNNYQMDY